jgi:hypothetical protein
VNSAPSSRTRSGRRRSNRQRSHSTRRSWNCRHSRHQAQDGREERASSDDIRFKPDGTGPFTLAELTIGPLKTTFTCNAKYWREGLPKSECLTVTAITEPISRVAALESGDADIVLVVDPATIGTLKANPNVTLTKAPGGTAVTMGMFIDVPPFDDIRVRQAMKLVIDRQAIVDTALLGFGIPGNDNPIMPTSPDAYRTDVMQRDVAKAKQLLAEAGHADGITVDLHAADLMPGTMAMVQAYQQMASDAGIKINIINESAGEYWDNIWLKQAFAVSNLGHADDTGRAVGRVSQGCAWNETHFRLDKYDVCSTRRRRLWTTDARRKLYQEAQQLISERRRHHSMFANIGRHAGAARLHAGVRPQSARLLGVPRLIAPNAEHAKGARQRAPFLFGKLDQPPIRPGGRNAGVRRQSPARRHRATSRCRRRT